MNKKKRGNDAIPSWSGFNYQGKIMLLNVLMNINSIISSDNIALYSVELEKREDFVILRDGCSQSFYQVKATLSKNKWSSHSEAMNKLLLHRNSSDNLTAPCYFVVAKEISDWNDTVNTYASSITLFKYSGNIVGVCDVNNYIISEILKYTQMAGYPSGKEDIIYSELCLFLDEKVAQMHQQGVKKRNYIIPFADFVNIISDSIGKQTARQEFYLKEQAYEYVTQSLQYALENICTNVCNLPLSDCETLCAAKTAYQNMLKLPNLMKYCKVINPSIINGWDNKLQLVAYMPVDKMELAVYHLFFESKFPDKVGTDGDAIYLQTKHCEAANRCVIPTILDLSSCYVYGENSLQETFQNIKNNTEILDVLEGNGISVLPGNWYGQLSQAEISTGWADTTDDPENNINNLYKGIEIISLTELMGKFREEGGNHD